MWKRGTWRSRSGAAWCAVSSDSMSPKVPQRGQGVLARVAVGWKLVANIEV